MKLLFLAKIISRSLIPPDSYRDGGARGWEATALRMAYEFPNCYKFWQAFFAQLINFELKSNPNESQ